VSTDCVDCKILFTSDDYSVHLRHEFSSFALAEKYLLWIWGSTARSVLRAPILGQKLYAKGCDSSVERTPASTAVYELCTPEGRAVLGEPYATIFSHLMQKSEEDVEQMLRADL
jgi:hypothetical protein